MKLISHGPEETFGYGKRLGKTLKAPQVICFFGDLAAGKTTFIKGLVEGASGISSDLVNSPTFVLLNIYEGIIPVYHFDLYRLEDEEGFFSLGFDEYWHAPGICCIEWAERIFDVLPPNALLVNMKCIGEGQREITIEGMNDVEKT